jgi:hypothetical protein
LLVSIALRGQYGKHFLQLMQFEFIIALPYILIALCVQIDMQNPHPTHLLLM